MAVIRRHPRLFGGLSLTLALLALVWLLWPHVPPAQADPGYDPLDPVKAARVHALRRALALDNDVLACLDLESPQLESLLAQLRSWYETNSTDLAQRQAAVADQRARVRQLESAVNMGEDRVAELTAARQQLATLEAQYATYLAGVRQSLIGGLPAPSQALVARMDAARELPMPFRVLALTPEQLQACQAARTRYQQRLTVARTNDQRVSAQAAYEQDLEAAIGTQNLQTLAALKNYLGPASERVVAALNLVLPARPRG